MLGHVDPIELTHGERRQRLRRPCPSVRRQARPTRER